MSAFPETGRRARVVRLRTPPVVCVLGPTASGVLIALRIGARLPVLVFDARRGRSRARGTRGLAGVLQVASLLEQLAGADIYVIATGQDQFDNAIDTVSLVLAPGAIVVFATHARMRQRDGRAVHTIEACTATTIFTLPIAPRVAISCTRSAARRSWWRAACNACRARHAFTTHRDCTE